MSRPTILIMHTLPHRVRLKLSHPLRDEEKVIETMKDGDRIKAFTYNKITKSVIIEFDNVKTDLEETIIRLAIVYSKEYDMTPINIYSNSPTRDMPKIAYYSLLTILGASISKLLKPAKNIQELFNWLAVGTTVAAIGEHAYMEINKKGAFDPEVVSVMYLINSLSKGNFVIPSILTWITTFGRHILNLSYDNVVLNIKEEKNMYTDEVYYEVSLSKEKDIEKKSDFFKAIISGYLEKPNYFCKNNFVMANNEGAFFNRKMYKSFNCDIGNIILNDKYI
ncbi:hypothetical protein RBU49_06550 [Clostridium sp. MB40-C1]|uniref:hypothetical protein n=1 Tax=Clostridium sp. MB40-C1 TaxID=3070996 RepID=UPI0027E05F88|nr:hypothetical protein [Clostridium sp. MB40-C1]WMJ81902.1 hypothetical protein RBU49_06550 [Clostridium sp. MB40-C1]